MRRLLTTLLSAGLILVMTSCATNPADEPPYQTARETVTIVSPALAETEYPAENPPADEDPGLGDESREESSSSQQADEGGEEEESGVTETAATQTKPAVQSPDEVRAVWFSYLEFETMLKGLGEEQFRQNISGAFGEVADAGFNTVFVQVRPNGDALYDSDYFPWSYVASGAEGQDPGFDPLQVMIEEARARALRLEAWINPYRVRASGNDKPLSSENQAQKWQSEGSDDVVSFSGGLYYNPASEKARELIVNGVREILLNYEVAGIHFDDYFFPTTEAAFDQDSYDRYKAEGGELSLSNWRRENVNTLVQQVYRAVKETKSSAVFGISPQGNNENNYNKQFIDVAKWLANEGYVDYICPQVYFGFENESAPFQRTVEEWDRMVKSDSVKLYIGIAPYKLGLQDQWAGSGSNEWIGTRDLLCKMVEASREQESYGGFAMYRYASLFAPDAAVSGQVAQELSNLKALMQ